MEATCAAVVVGAGTNGLGIVRALGKEGVAVTVIDRNARRPAMLSRYSRPRIVHCVVGLAFVESLREILLEFSEPPVLFVTEETPLMAVSEFRDHIDGLCKILLPDHCLLESLMSKSAIDDMAVKFGIAAPRTLHLRSKKDFSALKNLRYPCVLKPGQKLNEYAARFKKGYKLASADEVIAIAEEIFPVLPDLVVQEWIEGGERDLYFCLVYIGDDGKLVAAFTGRKLRCWPLPVGGTASCGPAPEKHDLLLEKTLYFFEKAGFTGLGGIEYKYNAADDSFYLIEPTVSRTDFQHEVAVLNGVNIPYAAYCHLTGLPSTNNSPEARYAWLETVTEKWSKEISGAPDSLVYGDLRRVGALFRWSDPKPWLVSKHNDLKRKIRSLPKKIRLAP